jgi:diaminohydroxyphosphoribosylaminopyrimidine deaminase/5-amino-6-(5-phosphoribosylamino)uracil reductase
MTLDGKMPTIACSLLHVYPFTPLPLLVYIHCMVCSLFTNILFVVGKIAASSGHAAWVSGELSRARVFRMRAQSDAVIVGGNTVRRDNPSLTTRKEEGHQPVRIVMSRGLDLPEKANLWDISKSPTIVMTQKGSKKEFQKMLTDHGVEVVEFELLTPRRVMEYCYTRGFLQIMWECGGLLSAPAISSGVIHKVLAFIAPKIVGGVLAPTPVGELGMLQMTQALNLSEVEFEKVGPDMLVSGYLQPLPDLPFGNSYGGQSKGQLTFA